MKSVIICEGKIDSIFLSYYLSSLYNWKSVDCKDGKEWVRRNDNKKRLNEFVDSSNNPACYWYFRDDDNILGIYSVKSNSNIGKGVDQIFNINLVTTTTAIDKMVIITDRDDENVEKRIITLLSDKLRERKINIQSNIKNNEWIKTFYNKNGETIEFDILLLIIPFETTGTIESFLLDCLSQKSIEEHNLVDLCDNFIELALKEDYIKDKYLNSRGIIPKAKFSAYFSVTSPNRTFDAGDKILKSIPWEEYTHTQQTFQLLSQL